MAIFQFHMQIIGRSEGRSVIASSAYRSGEKLENTYTGTTEDYTKKKWIEHKDVLLPSNAPAKFCSREVLWNNVEQTEKGKNAQLAREIEVALPIELTMEENIQLLNAFVKDTLVSDGMIADVAIHNPPVTDNNGIPINSSGEQATNINEMIFSNPHAHILLTMRPMDENGKWKPKTQKEYLCKRGNETKAFTSEEFKDAKTEGWQKQYQYYQGNKKVWLTPTEAFSQNLIRVSKNPRSTPFGRRDAKLEYWNSTDAIFQYRKSWETYVNQALENAGRPERIDCRSYQEQGKDTVSGIHLGHQCAQDPASDKYVINEEIKRINKANKKIRETLDDLDIKLQQKNDSLYTSLGEQFALLESEIISAQYSLEMLEEKYSLLSEKTKNLQLSVTRIQNIQQNIKDKDQLSQKKIALYQEELKKTYPRWSDRPIQIKKSIQNEQESIIFRKERFSKVLLEEGFADIQDFQQKTQTLKQMQKEQEQLSKNISSCREKINEYTEKYKELCEYLPNDLPSLEQFDSHKEQSFQYYQEEKQHHLQSVFGNIDFTKYRRIAHKTRYTLHHTCYLINRASYFLQQMEKACDEQNSQQHHI